MSALETPSSDPAKLDAEVRARIRNGSLFMLETLLGQLFTVTRDSDDPDVIRKTADLLADLSEARPRGAQSGANLGAVINFNVSGDGLHGVVVQAAPSPASSPAYDTSDAVDVQARPARSRRRSRSDPKASTKPQPPAETALLQPPAPEQVQSSIDELMQSLSGLSGFSETAP